MAKRTWEQSRKWVNLYRPHQVIVRTEDMTFRQLGPLHDIASEIDRTYRTLHARYCDESYQVLCFAEREKALIFHERSGGEIVHPEEFGKFGIWTPTEVSMCWCGRL